MLLARLHAERNRAVHLVLSEVQDLRSGNGGTKDTEHRTGVEATRHHRRNEVGRQSLHDLVASRETGEEVPAGDAGGFCRDEGARDDARAGVGEHAEGVQLAASHRHLRVGKGGTALRHLRAVHHDAGAVAYPSFFGSDELYGLLAIP